jgi:hypothetical protein
MLRVAFLPSDFDPMVLMLGEAGDLRCLAGVLRQFARNGDSVRLDRLAFCAATRTRITLAQAADRVGMLPTEGAAGHYSWYLDGAQAAAFAELVEDLAVPSRVAGSELLECGTGEGIPVKISRGEYTDDFLLETPASCGE